MLNPRFGVSLDPTTASLDETIARAQLADDLGLDVLTLQDHPYNRRFLETWTLLTALAMKTERINVGTNVANLPLRPPAMLAKMAATLDVMTKGRVELGLGAGFFWAGVEAYGVPARSPGDAYAAFEDALHILRGMWDNAGHSFTYEGRVYRVKGAQPGPAPAHRIPIWVGATGPRMLRLTGRMADGLLVSISYVPPTRLQELNRLIDEGAAEAGRPPEAIRRGYNLMGIIDLSGSGRRPSELKPDALFGTAREWIERIHEFYAQYRQDTFIFWPGGEDGRRQLEVFANEIAPGVREAVSSLVVTQQGE